ncbi:MAG: hypothetical protein U0359_41685, partial [Byssovorax sp.]
MVLGRDARRKGQRDGAAPPAAPDARGRRRAARALLVALPAALLGWGGVLLHGRPDALPFTAPAVKLRDLGEVRAIPMAGGFPEAHWLRLDSGDDPRASLFVV